MLRSVNEIITSNFDTEAFPQGIHSMVPPGPSVRPLYAAKKTDGLSDSFDSHVKEVKEVGQSVGLSVV